MANQQNIEDAVSWRNIDNQYNNLLFGGTTNSCISDSSSSSNINQNEKIQGNDISASEPLCTGECHMSDNTEVTMNENSSGMDTGDMNTQAGEVPFHPHKITVNDQNSGEINDDDSPSIDTTGSRGNLQSVTTDNVCANNQCINLLEYCREVLGNLNDIVHALEPILIQHGIPVEDTDCLLKNIQVPFSPDNKMAFKKSLETFGDILQACSDVAYGIIHVQNRCTVGKESNEPVQSRISTLNEPNDDQLNMTLQTSTNSLSQETCSTALPLSLSQLLSQAQRIEQEFNLIQLKIAEQPQQFWRNRSINCLCKKWCPAIQGESGTQRYYIHIKWSKLINSNPNNLFILVQLLSHDNKIHPTKVLVPPKTKVNQEQLSGKKRKQKNRRLTLDDLVIDDMYGFDKNTKSILCSITEKEYNKRESNLKLIMFSLYKTSGEITNLTSSGNEETDGDDEEVEDMSIEDQLNKLCKFRICLYRKTVTGELENVSNFVDTKLIEESKSNQELAINPTEVTPKHLCKCGNEKITVPLNTDSEKNGFVVHLNGKQLPASQIRGVTNKQISFASVPHSKHGKPSLHIMISKTSISETIKQNHNPYDGLDEIKLLDMNINYVEYNGNEHNHLSVNTEQIPI